MFQDDLKFLFPSVFPEFRIIHERGQYFASSLSEELFGFLTVRFPNLLKEKLRVMEKVSAPDGLSLVL